MQDSNLRLRDKPHSFFALEGKPHARFARPPSKGGSQVPSKTTNAAGTNKHFVNTEKDTDRPSGTSFVSVLQGNDHLRHNIAPSPALVLDDPCVVDRDYGNFVMGELKTFSLIPNLHSILLKEGFQNVNLTYIGGFWVMMELDSVKTKDNLLQYVGVSSWFQRLGNVQPDFVAYDQIVWVDIEGVSPHAWSRATFTKICSKWGQLMELEEDKDDSFARKRICVKTRLEDNILEKFKIIICGKIFVVRAKELLTWFPVFKGDKEVEYCSDDDSLNGEKTCFGESGGLSQGDAAIEQPVKDIEQSNDPFGIYDLLGKKDAGVGSSDVEKTPPFPPGFTPSAKADSMERGSRGKVNSINRSVGSRVVQDAHNIGVDLGSSGRGPVCSQNKGGSMLDLLDGIIKIGKTMGYSMKGCERDIEGIIGTQGAKGVNDDILLSRVNLMKQLNELKASDTRELVQKAKVQWAVEGAENSKFFHGILNKKRATLSIRGIMLDGVWVVDQTHVKEIFRSYFASRFNDPGDTNCKINYNFPNCLLPDQASDLECQVSNDEIRQAVWGCGEDKSPGPDGFTFDFKKKYWSTIGLDFCIAVKWFFDHNSFSRGCNSSFVSLIPKTSDPKFVLDYRPISLIGCLYKVVTKVLATRLFMVISGLISDVQTSFVPNRQILDGPFIVNELLDWCKRHKHKAIVFKVDFAKAYDAIFIGEWSDDNLNRILQVLHCFSLASGLKINVHKSQLLGVGIPLSISTAAASVLGCTVMSAPFKYLGVMVGGNMSRIKAWDAIIQQLKSRLSKWKLKTLSIGGRFTLLKSVLGASPIYAMSIFKFPVDSTFRRPVRGGAEASQLANLLEMFSSVILSDSCDKWFWDLNGNGVFCVKDVRRLLDVFFSLSPMLLLVGGITLNSLLCPSCNSPEEEVSHSFFTCHMAIDIFRNQMIFASSKPRKAVIFDDIVERSFLWCSSRCN
nr:RNA-directed DNA polymerase, eukaryota [Tanacetum cinerariifolium]